MTDALAHNTPYDWIELAAFLASGKMVRDHYVRVGDLTAISAWTRRFNHTDTFSSIAFYLARDNISACILPLYFDIDCADDLPATRESTLTLCEMLMDRACVPQESLDICFSGAKGFHVVVAPEVLCLRLPIPNGRFWALLPAL